MSKSEQKLLRTNIIIICAIAGFYAIIKFKNGLTEMAIGILAALVVIIGVFAVLSKLNVRLYIRGIILVTIQMGLIFVISLSGESLTDDYILYIASVIISSIYFRPSYVIIQALEANLWLAGVAMLDPSRFGTTGSQTMLCWVCVDAAFVCCFLMVMRGKFFITQAHKKADESAALLNGLQEIQNELGENVSSVFNEITAMGSASSTAEDACTNMQLRNTEIQRAVNESTDEVNRLFENISICASSSDEISSIIGTVVEMVDKNSDSISVTKQQLTIVNDTMTQLNDLVSELNDTMQNIKNYSKEIDSIARQTNIISLNAAVEAAKSGSAGAGFAVVADEVRSLAAQSRISSDKISSAIENLESVITKTIEESQLSMEAVNGSMALVDELTESFTALSDNFSQATGSISEQGNAIQLIQSSGAGIMQKMQDADSSCSEGESAAQNLFSEVFNLNSGLQQLKNNADGMRVLTEKMAQESASHE